MIESHTWLEQCWFVRRDLLIVDHTSAWTRQGNDSCLGGVCMRFDDEVLFFDCAISDLHPWIHSQKTTDRSIQLLISRSQFMLWDWTTPYSCTKSRKQSSQGHPVDIFEMAGSAAKLDPVLHQPETFLYPRDRKTIYHRVFHSLRTHLLDNLLSINISTAKSRLTRLPWSPSFAEGLPETRFREATSQTINWWHPQRAILNQSRYINISNLLGPQIK